MSVQFIASVPLLLVENSCLSSNDHNKDPEYQKVEKEKMECDLQSHSHFGCCYTG